MKKKYIIMGYGNPDRGDDGVAFYIINRLLSVNGLLSMDLFSQEIIPLNSTTDLWFNLQLLPEVANILGNYETALFIDAHTSEINEEIQFIEIDAIYQTSPFTHHISPQTCLAITKEIFGKAPKSYLVSILGTEFQFTTHLSQKTNSLADMAINQILEMIEN